MSLRRTHDQQTAGRNYTSRTAAGRNYSSGRPENYSSGRPERPKRNRFCREERTSASDLNRLLTDTALGVLKLAPFSSRRRCAKIRSRKGWPPICRRNHPFVLACKAMLKTDDVAARLLQFLAGDGFAHNEASNACTRGTSVLRWESTLSPSGPAQ